MLLLPKCVSISCHPHQQQGNIRFCGCDRLQKVFEVLAVVPLVEGDRRQTEDLVAKRRRNCFPERGFAAQWWAAEDYQVL